MVFDPIKNHLPTPTIYGLKNRENVTRGVEKVADNVIFAFIILPL